MMLNNPSLWFNYVLPVVCVIIACLVVYRYFFINRSLFWVQEIVIRSTITVSCKYTLSISTGFDKLDRSWKVIGEGLRVIEKEYPVLTLTTLFSKLSVHITRQLHNVQINTSDYRDVQNAQINLIYLEHNIISSIHDHGIGGNFKIRVSLIRRIVTQWP